MISDDHSTDRTWDVIQDEVDAYRRSGGKHANIVLNRNERNLGLIKHCEVANGLKHGILRVGGGGDDISEPDRVEQIVQAWLESGKPMAIYSGAWLIDIEGKRIGQLGEYYLTQGCLGAVAAYSIRFSDFFDPVTMTGAAEDTIFAERINILGGKRVYLRKNLMSYRVGSGMSTVVRKWRKPNLTAHLLDVQSYSQCLLDLEHRKGTMSQERYLDLKRRYETRVREGRLHAQLLDSNSIRERWRAYRQIHYHPWFRPGGIFQLLCLLPKGLGDPCLNVLACFCARYNKKRMEWF